MAPYICECGSIRLVSQKMQVLLVAAADWSARGFAKNFVRFFLAQ